jgi:hypothetical protein
MLDKPQGDGKETPGAKAGSRQSRSIEIYFLPLLLFLDLILSEIFKIPNSSISKGVIISNPTYMHFPILQPLQPLFLLTYSFQNL